MKTSRRLTPIVWVLQCRFSRPISRPIYLHNIAAPWDELHLSARGSFAAASVYVRGSSASIQHSTVVYWTNSWTVSDDWKKRRFRVHSPVGHLKPPSSLTTRQRSMELDCEGKSPLVRPKSGLRSGY